MTQDTSSKIKGFRVRAVRVPMAERHQTASGVITESPLVLTDVITDAGITGHSIVFTYTPAALKPTAELIQNLEPLVKGEMLAPIEARASDFVMLDVMKVGGVTGWLRAASLAHSEGLLMSNHLWPEISAHLLCCTPTAHWLEYADWWNPILAKPLRVENGMAIVGDNIGTGVSWNEDAVGRFEA